MDKEIRISLPFYKIAYALFFVVILSLIRRVTDTSEIGIALETPMAILAAVFCADTYVQEIVSRRSEIQRLYPIKKRFHSVISRMLVQEIFLLLLAIAGYGFVYIFQKPVILNEVQKGLNNEIAQFAVYLVAMVITLNFWGILSHTLACFFNNMWYGMGCCLVLWLITNSTFGKRCLGSWGLFSYTFRNTDDSCDLSFMWGKVICICSCIVMVGMLKKILKKRG